MSNSLTVIKDKIESIGYGLFRLTTESEHQIMTIAPSSTNNFDSLNCIIKEQETGTSLLNREVRLIQRDNNNYLYISGQINDEVKNNSKIVSLKIIKACWFIKKKKGNIAWMQEKYMYENLEGRIEQAS